MAKELVCPRCGSTELDAVECGPDTYDDDITWTSHVCRKCGLRHSGWYDVWVECDSWQREREVPAWKGGLDNRCPLPESQWDAWKRAMEKNRDMLRDAQRDPQHNKIADAMNAQAKRGR